VVVLKRESTDLAITAKGRHVKFPLKSRLYEALKDRSSFSVKIPIPEIVKVNSFARSNLSSSLLGNGLLFVVSILAGWCVFNLQIISLVRLLEEVGIEVLPVLMIVQASMSWVLLRFWGNAALGSSHKFLYSALAVGASTTLIAHLGKDGQSLFNHNTLLFGALFVFSQLSVSALRMGIHVVFSKQISVLRTPQISTQLSIAEESGFLLGVLVLMFFPQKVGNVSVIVSCAPFLLAASVIALLQARMGVDAKSKTPEPIQEQDKSLLSKLKSLGQGAVKPLLSLHHPMTNPNVRR